MFISRVILFAFKNWKIASRYGFASGVFTRTRCLFPQGFTVGLINVGAPAAGMNSAGRAAVRLAQCEGHTVLGIRDGFDGLMADKVCFLSQLST